MNWFVELILVIDTLILFFRAYRKIDSDIGMYESLITFICRCNKNKPKKQEIKDKKSEKKKDKKTKEIEQEWQTSLKKISRHYLGGNFIQDFLSLVPYLVTYLIFLI